MSFLNKNNSNFKNCFSVVVGDFLYTAVTLVDYSSIVLMKTDFSGNTIWKKKITDGSTRYKVRGLLKFSNNELLVLVETTEITADRDTYLILRVDLNAIVKYQRKFSFNASGTMPVDKLLLLNNDRFCILFQKLVIIFDSQGAAISQKEIKPINSADYFTTSDIEYYGTKVIIIGTFIDNVTNARYGIILDTNTDLVISTEYKVSKEIYNVYVTNENKILVGNSTLSSTYISEPFNIGEGTVNIIFYAGGVGNGYRGNFVYSKTLKDIYYWWNFNNSLNLCKLNNAYNLDWYKELLYSGYYISPEVINNKIIVKGYTNQNSSTLWGTLNSAAESCISNTRYDGNIFGKTTLQVLAIQPNISITAVNKLVSLSTSAITISNFSLNKQEICPQVYDYTLKLESSTINVPQLRAETIPEKDVGNIIVSNAYTASATLVEETIIAEENGVRFSVKTTTFIPANNSGTNVPIVVSGYAEQTGSFSPLIDVKKPNLSNPNNIRISFSVIEAIIDAEIVDTSLSINTYIKDHPFDPNPDYYGRITIKNNSLAKLEIPAGTVLCIETENNFVFKTFIQYAEKTTSGTNAYETIYPLSEGNVNVEILLSNDNNNQPKVAGNYDILINEIHIDQYKTIRNPHNFTIQVNVIDEATNAFITDSSKLSAKTFIKDYQIPTEVSIGFITIENRSANTNLIIPQGTLLHTESNINGIVFKTKNSLTDLEIPHGESREVEIVATGKAGSLVNNFSFPINIPDPEIINENNQHQITFNVIEDTLDVELIRKRFVFPELKIGQNINELAKNVGTITLQNKSQVKAFTLSPKTKIHSISTISGLVIQTENTNGITINAGESKSIGVEIKTPAAPTNFGDFSEMIFIPNVSNPRYYTIDFDVLSNGISVGIDENMSLQSPDFTLQTVGSKGIDSPKGIQLRWMFGGNLGQKHLPKGDLAGNITHNYNKPEDYVKVYRAPYVRAVLLLDLLQGPSLLDDSKRCWIYKITTGLADIDIPARFKVTQRTFHIYFRNERKYDELRQPQANLIDPFENPEDFLLAYGENVIEIECKEELFFRVRPIVNPKIRGNIYFEMLSAEENKLVTPKTLSYRKIMTSSEINKAKLFIENGRSIRYRTEGVIPFSFEFEFYSDFIASASYWKSWEDFGEYSLINNPSKKILNLILGDINGKWLRYNDGEYVNTQNYIDKWNYSPVSENDFKRGIKQIVERYLYLSNSDPSNPRAEEYLDINFSNQDYIPEVPGENNGGTLISNLDMLNIAALDYHVARLLGLGMLDLTSEVTARADEYIYLTEYKTLKDPQNENLEKDCQLLSISIPTSVNTERLPFPIEIAELYKGMPKNPNEDIPVLYDDEGYTYDGKSRFVSIINKPLPSVEVNPPFFANNMVWDSTQYTLPVYAGLEYRIGNSDSSIRPDWEKPELSHDDEYFNVTALGTKANLETVPIIIPENFGTPLYVHRQTKSGKYFYSAYGINIFSRAASSNTTHNIITTIKPKNNLLPPSDVRSWLIQPEKPLMFTSEFEQDKYKEIADEDKTFARVSFDYNSTQDMVTYSIPPDKNITDDEYIHETTRYFPDEYDVFADHIEVYFRDEIPKSISARLYEVAESNDKLCVIFKTKKYEVISTGETLYSKLPEGTTVENFIGSLFVVNNKSYVIKSIINGPEGLIFTVYKEEVSQTILSGGNISVDFQSLTTPVTSGNDLFVVTENMQSESVWGTSKNPNKFEVPLEFPETKREVITAISESGSVQKYLEKSRGFWLSAEIGPYLEIENKPDGSTEFVHKGIYVVKVPDLDLGTSLSETEYGFYEKNNGYVRVFRNKNVSENTFLQSRAVLKVIRTEPFGRYLNLYVYDSEFKFDEYGNPSGNLPENEIQTGSSVSINYYPSYFLYLYKDVENNLTKDTVLPSGDQISKQSIFGLRSVDIDNKDISGKVYKSKFSIPSLMVGLKITLPQPPEQPIGSLYATRPDFYGKSTYSFTTKFKQKPYSVQFCRTDNIALLSALYDQKAIDEIFDRLSLLGGNDEGFLANRWMNFFDYETLKSDGQYKTYPERIREIEELPVLPEEGVSQKKNELEESQIAIPVIRGYAFPLPDKLAFFEGINNFIKQHNENTGQTVNLIAKADYGRIRLNDIIIPAVEGVNEEILLIDFIKETLDYTFVPLTEIPIIYQHIKKYEHHKPYLPLNKKQVVRDGSGYLLKPPVDPNLESDFDMAPMMTILDEKENNTLFTDFTLNGTTNSLYFYASREIGSQMKMSDLSEVLGPVKLVDSNPAEAPKILSALPILENMVLGINPKIKIDIQPYPEVQRISRVNLYRAYNKLDAESILSMELIKQIYVSNLEINEDGSWKIYDELEGFNQIPYGDTLFYRVTVDKEIQYADPEILSDGTQNIIIDYAPSQASKTMAFLLAETCNPNSPVIAGLGVRPANEDYVNQVKIEWKTTCYKGSYHLFSMSAQGNWKEIARCIVNPTNDKVQLQVYNSNLIVNEGMWENKEIINIVEGKIILPFDLLGSEYLQLPLFDENGIRRYYHFKIIAENTSNMFSTQENILTLFTDEIWNDLQGISSNGTSDGMIIEKTFIIK